MYVYSVGAFTMAVALLRIVFPFRTSFWEISRHPGGNPHTHTPTAVPLYTYHTVDSIPIISLKIDFFEIPFLIKSHGFSIPFI